jgi:hypothetical protein
MLMTGLSQRYGAGRRAWPGPPWLSHPGRRWQAAATSAEPSAAGTKAADLIDGPPLRRGQRDRYRIPHKEHGS